MVLEVRGIPPAKDQTLIRASVAQPQRTLPPSMLCNKGAVAPRESVGERADKPSGGSTPPRPRDILRARESKLPFSARKPAFKMHLHLGGSTWSVECFSYLATLLIPNFATAQDKAIEPPISLDSDLGLT